MADRVKQEPNDKRDDMARGESDEQIRGVAKDEADEFEDTEDTDDTEEEDENEEGSF